MSRTINPLAQIEAGQLKDDKVSAVANGLGVTIEVATQMVARLEKQQAYRKQYQQSDAAKAYRLKRYQQMKQVAALLRAK